MIADAVKAQLGVEVDRKRIATGGAIKTAGAHVVDVNFYREIGSKVTVMVGTPVEEEPAEEPEAAEAEQAETAEAPAEESAE